MKDVGLTRFPFLPLATGHLRMSLLASLTYFVGPWVVEEPEEIDTSEGEVPEAFLAFRVDGFLHGVASSCLWSQKGESQSKTYEHGLPKPMQTGF